MKKPLIFGALLFSSFLFNSQALAEENQEELEAASERATIVFDGTQDEVITDSLIIRKVTDLPAPSVTPYTAITRAAGKWDYLGEQYVTGRSAVYPSNGGDYMVTIIQPDNDKYIYDFKEEDPIWDQTVDTFTIEKSANVQIEVIFRNISGWLDGDDNKAEFYINKLNKVTTSVSAAFWD